MRDSTTLLDDVRIASPCTASWEQMTGTDTVRFCDACKLNVYNLSDMTAAEAAALVSGAEGRLCVRLYKRKDGTVLTRDCPVGLRAAVRRATRAAGAALTAVLGLLSTVAGRTVWAQNGGPEAIPVAGALSIDEPRAFMGKAVARRGEDVTVSVTDDQDNPIVDAKVLLTSLGEGDSLWAEPLEDGQYRITGVEPGVYTLTVSATGRETSKPKTVRVKQGRPVQISVTLEAEHVLMGEIALPSDTEPTPEKVVEIETEP